MNDDGHSPATCNWFQCKAVSDVPCPFTKDGTEDDLPDVPFDLGCEHEWRQYLTTRTHTKLYSGIPIGERFELVPDGFYCTKCTERKAA